MSVFTNGVYAKLVTDRIGVGVTVTDGQVTAGPLWYIGFVTANPNGVVTGNIGSVLYQNDGTQWTNANGATGWVATGGIATGWNLLNDVAGTWGTTSPLQAESLYVSASNRFDLRTKATSGTQASTAVRVQTGSTSVTTAVIGGGSGGLELGTGLSDANNAGATGGPSGPVSVYTGDCTSTLGTSGSSSPVQIKTGASDDGNSGAIELTTGAAPSGTRGVLDVNIPTWDLSTQATTFTLADNDAAAWVLSSAGAPGILVVSTVNGSEAVGCSGRLTTQDGVSAGTARVVGGRAFGSTAVSATISGGAGAQSYNVSYSIPADTLKAGSSMTLSAVVKATGQNAGDTFAATLRVGGQVVATCSAFDIAPNDFGNMRAVLNTLAAPGAAVQTIVQGQGGWTTAGAPYANTGLDGVFATNGALVVDVQITYGSASAGNTSVLSSLLVSIT